MMLTRKLYAVHTRLIVAPFIINSLPKAGTHLVGKVMRLFPGVRFAGVEIDNSTAEQFALRSAADAAVSIGVDWPIPLSAEAVRAALRAIPKGRFAAWHAPYSADLDTLLSQIRMKSLLILRDPRDVAVSHARFLATNETHFLYRRYRTLSPDEQLMASITGLEPSASGESGLLDIGTRCRSVGAWSRQPYNYTTTFEKLVGPQGGGAREAQLAEIARIADHIGLLHPRPLLNWIAERVFGGTRTFHKGAIGGWPEHFTAEHKRAFKEVAGPILIEWGYEDDDNW